VGERKLGRIMRLAESFYGQTSTRQKSGARGLCVYTKLHGKTGFVFTLIYVYYK
jgi:hypothetical protein